MLLGSPGPHEARRYDGVTVTAYADKEKPFLAGGKLYRNAYALSGGLRVVHVKKRYPCFDDSDEAYEDRSYHWFLFADTLAQANALRARYGGGSSPDLPCLHLLDSADGYRALPGRSVVYYEDGLNFVIVSEKA